MTGSPAELPPGALGGRPPAPLKPRRVSLESSLGAVGHRPWDTNLTTMVRRDRRTRGERHTELLRSSRSRSMTFETP